MMTFASESSAAAGSGSDPAAVACDEAELIRQAATGDTKAFGQIVHHHHRRVFNYLSHLARHHHDAEDLTQQTFVKAFHHIARFDQRRPLINWLLTIARNTALNHFRDVKKWDEMPEDPVGSDPTPAHQAEEKEQAENLWARARTLLSPREFEVLWLRFAEELSTRETAQVVGLTETHVKVLVFRARAVLLKGVKSS